MTELQLFNFNGTPIRVVKKDDEVWFVGNDVAAALGYSLTAKAIRTHCKGVSEVDTPTAGGIQSVKIIPERDVYRLIMRSKLPSAQQFEEWVVGEVLPTIRKHGAYLTSSAIERTLTDPDYLIQLAQRLKSEQLARIEAETARVTAEMARIAAETTAVQLAQECANLRPHAELGKQFVAVKNGATSSQVAANFCKSARWLNDFLHRRQRLKKVNGQWLLSGRWHDKPYLVTRHNFRKNSEDQLVDHPDSLWTPEGQIAVVQLLEHEGFTRVLSTQKLRTFPQKEQE